MRLMLYITYFLDYAYGRGYWHLTYFGSWSLLTFTTRQIDSPILLLTTPINSCNLRKHTAATVI